MRLIDEDTLLDDIEAAKENGGMWDVVASTLKRYVKRLPTIDADAIEQLVKERDAAIADLGHAGFCDYCKHFGYPRCKKSGRCEWEWRGVQEAHADD